MNLRPWVAAPLAGAAIALLYPSVGVAAPDGHHRHHSPWRDCHSHRGVVLIDTNLRVILTDGRRGPEALVLQGSPGPSSSSPAAPWDSFSISTYLNVDYPTETSGQYQFAIRDFFRMHPLFVVTAFGSHERVFPFPAAHCVDDQDDGDRGDRARPHGGTTADGSGSSGYPSPQKGDHRQNGQTPPGPRNSAAAGWSAGHLSAKHILVAAGGLLMVLGMLATAWLRRRRSAA